MISLPAHLDCITIDRYFGGSRVDDGPHDRDSLEKRFVQLSVWTFKPTALMARADFFYWIFEMTSTLMERRVGEVVESTSTSFVAQSYQLEGAPALGGLVRTDSPDIYGVVGSVTTEPLDSARPVLARGEDAGSEEDVIRDNPQLARLLTSRFEVFIAGHVEDGVTHQYLPPRPPRVHSFVYACDSDETAQFTSQLDLLRLLLNSGASHSDEIVGACIRQTASSHGQPAEFLALACRALAVELSADVARLNSILRRVAL